MHGQQDKHIFGRPRKKASRRQKRKYVVAFLQTFLVQFQKQNDHHLGLMVSSGHSGVVHVPANNSGKA